MQNKNKHLTFKDRVLLEDLLNRGVTTFTTMTEVLQKDPSTVAKEVKRHQFLPTNRNTGRIHFYKHECLYSLPRSFLALLV